MSTIDLPATQRHPAVAAPASRYLYGPTADFLLLGGGSLIALLLLRWYLGGDETAKTTSLAITLALANLINHPHFAHSYQIFYGNYRAKLLSPEYTSELRLRYFLAGVVAPVALAGFFAWAVVGGHPRALGLAANAMFFLVGWHYVKQGYGMAMVDAVLKRAFYGDSEKRALLVNGYAAWILSWLLINFLLSNATKSYFGVQYLVIPVTQPVLLLAMIASFATTLWVCVSIWRRTHSRKSTAWNGLLAYAVSLYAWLLVRDPVVLLWVPAFHSLQYLAVVWRFQRNRIWQTGAGDGTKGISNWMQMAVFVSSGVFAGYAGFWLLPEWLSAHVAYDESMFGPNLFFFLFWIFINIHHYLLDTVMWRKGNPDVARYLFATGKSA